MEKITKANPGLLAAAKEPENAAEIEKERQAMKRRDIASKKKIGGKVKSAKIVMASRLKNLAKAVNMTGPKDAEIIEEVEPGPPPAAEIEEEQRELLEVTCWNGAHAGPRPTSITYRVL